jgi:type II secretory pathway pseudopilin PulG
VPPDNYGKLRIAVHNLEQGVEAEPAFRNAFGKTPAQIGKEAEAYLRAGQFATTSLRGLTLRPEKDFTAMPVPVGAEQAALADLSRATPAQSAAAAKERVDLRQVRVEADARRKEQEAEAKKRDAEQEQRELEALKQKSIASIQAALDQAQREHPSVPPSNGKVEAWWDGPRPDAKIEGLLTQVDCLGKQARLVIESKGAKPMRLLVPDSGKIVIIGGGEKTFGCGPQKPPRAIVVDYFAKPDAKLGTAGEAALIEFPR